MPTISVYVSEEVYDKLREMAKDEGKKVSAVAQRILEEVNNE